LGNVIENYTKIEKRKEIYADNTNSITQILETLIPYLATTQH